MKCNNAKLIWNTRKYLIFFAPASNSGREKCLNIINNFTSQINYCPRWQRGAVWLEADVILVVDSNPDEVTVEALLETSPVSDLSSSFEHLSLRIIKKSLKLS